MSNNDYVTQLEKFTENMGLDLSKWDLESDEITNNYSDENECRELCYRSKHNGAYSLYVVMEYFNPPEWEIIEFQMSGD